MYLLHVGSELVTADLLQLGVSHHFSQLFFVYIYPPFLQGLYSGLKVFQDTIYGSCLYRKWQTHYRSLGFCSCTVILPLSGGPLFVKGYRIKVCPGTFKTYGRSLCGDVAKNYFDCVYYYFPCVNSFFLSSVIHKLS